MLNIPAMDVYVISFGGWADEATYKQHAAAVLQKPKEERLPFDSRHAGNFDTLWFTA
jgi:hypothetical protein